MNISFITSYFQVAWNVIRKAKISIVLVFVMLFFAFSGWAEQDDAFIDELSTESMIHSWLEESAEENAITHDPDISPADFQLVEDQDDVPVSEYLGPVIPQDKPFIEVEGIESSSIETDAPLALEADNSEELDVSHLKEPESVEMSEVREGGLSPIQRIDYSPQPAKVAILIDDLGYSRRGMNESLALPKEVALAILPKTPFSQKTSLAAQEQQRIIMLHAPMENLRQLELGPGGLYAKMSEEELKTTLADSLDSLPGVIGVNNHMGSLLTAEEQSMKWVMEVLKTRSLFFIDSLTNAESVAEKSARESGLDTVSRDVFLDNIRTEKAIDRQFSRLIKLAKRQGTALAIGHPYPETMAYLKKRLNALEDDGVQLVPLTDVISKSEKAQ